MKRFSLLLITFLILNLSILHGQEIKKIRDSGIWAQVAVEREFNKKWEISLTQQFRFFDNVSKLNKLVSDFGCSYKINKQFKLAGGFRYLYDRKKDYTFTHDLRVNFDLLYEIKLSSKLDLEYRVRFQNSYTDLFTRFDQHREKSNIRNRIKLSYQTNENHTFYFSSELFRQYVAYRKPYFNDLRLSLGDQMNLKKGKFDFSFCVEHQLNDEHPLNFFFVRLGYTFNLKPDSDV